MTYQGVFYVEVRNWYCCILYLGLSRPLIKRKIHISFSAQLAVFFISKPKWQLHPTPQKILLISFPPVSLPRLPFSINAYTIYSWSRCSSWFPTDPYLFLVILQSLADSTSKDTLDLCGHTLSALTMQAITFSLPGNCTSFPQVFLTFTLGFLYVILHRDSRDFFKWYESTDTMSLLRNSRWWTTH